MSEWLRRDDLGMKSTSNGRFKIWFYCTSVPRVCVAPAVSYPLSNPAIQSLAFRC